MNLQIILTIFVPIQAQINQPLQYFGPIVAGLQQTRTPPQAILPKNADTINVEFLEPNANSTAEMLDSIGLLNGTLQSLISLGSSESFFLDGDQEIPMGFSCFETKAQLVKFNKEKSVECLGSFQRTCIEEKSIEFDELPLESCENELFVDCILDENKEVDKTKIAKVCVTRPYLKCDSNEQDFLLLKQADDSLATSCKTYNETSKVFEGTYSYIF